MACHVVVDLPLAAGQTTRIGAVARLSDGCRGHAVRVCDGAAELRKLAADAANDLRHLALRPFASRGPGLVVPRPVHRVAEAVLQAVLDHPGRSAIFANRQVYELLEMALLVGHVVASAGRMTLMHCKTPEPHRLVIGRLVQTPCERARAVGVEHVGEPRFVLVGVDLGERRHEAAAFVILKLAVVVLDPPAVVLIDERFEGEYGLGTVARRSSCISPCVGAVLGEGSAPREILEPRAVVYERLDELLAAGTACKILPALLPDETQRRILRNRQLLGLGQLRAGLYGRYLALRVVELELLGNSGRTSAARPDGGVLETLRLDLLAFEHEAAHRELPPQSVAAKGEDLLHQRLLRWSERLVGSLLGEGVLHYLHPLLLVGVEVLLGQRLGLGDHLLGLRAVAVSLQVGDCLDLSNCLVFVEVEVREPAIPVAGIELDERIPLLAPAVVAGRKLAEMEGTHLLGENVEATSIEVGGLLGGGRLLCLLEERDDLVLLLRQVAYRLGQLLAGRAHRHVLDLREHTEILAVRRIAGDRRKALRAYQDRLYALVG